MRGVVFIRLNDHWTTASVGRCHNLTIWNYTKLQILNLKWNSCFKTWFCACILNSNLFWKWFLSSDTNQQSWITWLGYLKRRNYKKITRLNKMLQLDNLTAIKSETAPSFTNHIKVNKPKLMYRVSIIIYSTKGLT